MKEKKGKTSLGYLSKKTLFIDDFEGASTIPGSDSWRSNDGTYTLTYDNIATGDGAYCLKIRYAKQQAWSFIHKIFHPSVDFSNYNKLKASIYVDRSITFLFKFENPFPDNPPGVRAQAHEKWWTLTGTGWQEIEWDLSDIKSDLNNVHWFLIMADPGNIGTSGAFYISNIFLVNETL
jgi:hypothetical protein